MLNTGMSLNLLSCTIHNDSQTLAKSLHCCWQIFVVSCELDYFCLSASIRVMYCECTLVCIPDCPENTHAVGEYHMFFCFEGAF